MNIAQERHNDVAVCIVEGDINIHSSVELRKVFDALIKGNTKKLLVDLAGVSYVDSSGLATLIEMLQRLKKIGGSLRVCGMVDKVKNVFEITKVYKLFSIYDTRTAALEQF